MIIFSVHMADSHLNPLSYCTKVAQMLTIYAPVNVINQAPRGKTRNISVKVPTLIYTFCVRNMLYISYPKMWESII